ncbi:MAG TPA: flagellar motor protein [Steroidobacteraceae bacterium]|nr:flagellar motor protein [Steroidobacteraceae bacterium]
MDILSIVGVFLALVALIGGSILKGAGVSSLMNPAAFVIVFVGTTASILLQTPLNVFLRALRIMPWAFKPPSADYNATIEKITEWSNLARKQGLLGLEPAIQSEPDEFARRGLQFLVDGVEPEALRETLEMEMDAREERETAAAKVFEGMGIYSPTLGIIGAVLGLIAVMKNLSDPSKLGHGIAAAFTATIYGIGLANLFLLPLAAKLKGAIKTQSTVRMMLLEGMVAIARGENPRNIEARLRGFVE